MERAKFLERVRTAAHAGRAYRVHTRDIPAGTGYVGVSEDRCERFAAEANAVGGHAIVVANDVAARAELSELLRTYTVRHCVMWQHPQLDRLRLQHVLGGANIAVDDYASLSALPHDAQRQRVLNADMGITSCQWAIAETGTLVMCHHPGQERVTSLVPPVHVALVDEEQILPDLFDVFTQLHLTGELPSNVTLITGPSKTGDIELQLTTGVHGPKHWHVIVIRRPT